MVRINIINPKYLLDQHLLAEWNETQMLLGTIVKYPNIKWQPETYKLGKGHINFFKDKVIYLLRRIIYLADELELRGYNIDREKIGDIYLNHNSDNPIDMSTQNDWEPNPETDFPIIVERLLEKHAMKPDWYTYYGKTMTIPEYDKFLHLCLK